MADDKMPQMGDQVNVGLTPVKEKKIYRIEYQTDGGSNSRFYIQANKLQDLFAHLRVNKIEFTKLTIERQSS